MPIREGEGIKENGYTLHIQRTRQKAEEERLLERYNIKTPDIFWGAPFEPQDQYECTVEIGAENWNKEFHNIEISIDKALREGKWQEKIKEEKYNTLRKFLDDHGWIDK